MTLELEAFGERLRRAIGRSGLSAAVVAVRADTDSKRLNRLIAAQFTNGPTLDEIRTLARVLNVNRVWLAFGDGQP